MEFEGCTVDFCLASKHVGDELEACCWIEGFDHLLKVAHLNQFAVLDVPQ